MNLREDEQSWYSQWADAGGDAESWIIDALCTRLSEAREELAGLKRDGWYLVSSKTQTALNGIFKRDGEAEHTANCLAWYEQAVFWRIRAEKAEKKLAAAQERERWIWISSYL